MFPATEGKIDEAEFVRKLKSYVNADLQEVPFVFVRRDQAKTPLRPSYEGSFGVLHRKEKYFKIDKNGEEDNVSIDRLKQSYICQESQIYEEHSYCQPAIRPIYRIQNFPLSAR
ncbi:hypothetical protein GWI33_011659 [Rhynchophorus ferrugineus]|uniref:Uncharacterized protein n=1 Tax=Rhynchophorus ferrugineus TaxID=354439 RepID=A0A834HKS2_RHYFE|nr:hypothetical protein GWI33_003543 [Rhynchophorus ferrugineus]KAF7275497.1 hypothetical protein GWI33_011659 [Rhynchophorus ferrugineus]